MEKISVLICDDSALMRRSLKAIIESDPGLVVAGTARDGEDAVFKARDLKPDVITMDINMPVIDGITALQHIMEDNIAPVIMVSSLTQEGAETTFEAMALGAFDYVPKPGGTVSVNIDIVARELISKVKAAGRKGTLRRLSRRVANPAAGRFENRTLENRTLENRTLENRTLENRTLENRTSEKRPVPVRRTSLAPPGDQRLPAFNAVALGVSTGGPKTLFEVLPNLPGNLNAAVFVVQHMPPKFITSFARRVNDKCHMPCYEAEAGMVVEPGCIYMGRGGFHLTLYRKLSKTIVIRTPGRPEHTFMPSVDVMMDSVVSVFGRRTVGVLLTGMGDDGADGMVKIRRQGGATIAESEETAIVFGMPQEAIKRGGAAIVRPSFDIAQEIIKAVR